jgi:hypothetical protein
MGPVLELPLEVGAAGSAVEVEVEDSVGEVSVAVPVDSSVAAVFVLEALVVSVPLLLVAVLSADLVPVRDPIVVGVARSVGVAVSRTETWLKSSGPRPKAVVATPVARAEDAPQPNWKKPPSKWLR